MSSKRKSDSYFESKQLTQTFYKHFFTHFSSQSEVSNKAILFQWEKREFFNQNKLAILIGIRATSKYELCWYRFSVFRLRFLNFSALQGVNFAIDSLFLTWNGDNLARERKKKTVINTLWIFGYCFSRFISNLATTKKSWLKLKRYAKDVMFSTKVRARHERVLENHLDECT